MDQLSGKPGEPGKHPEVDILKERIETLNSENA